VTRRSDLTLAALVFELLALAALLFLAWAQARGFDPSMCTAYGACGWREV